MNRAGFMRLRQACIQPREVPVAKFSLKSVDLFLVLDQLLRKRSIAGRENGVGDDLVFNDLAIELIELALASGGEARLGANLLFDQLREIFVDDVAHGFNFGEILQLPN